MVLPRSNFQTRWTRGLRQTGLEIGPRIRTRYVRRSDLGYTIADTTASVLAGVVKTVLRTCLLYLVGWPVVTEWIDTVDRIECREMVISTSFAPRVKLKSLDSFPTYFVDKLCSGLVSVDVII
jgi:hypothetical protein